MREREPGPRVEFRKAVWSDTAGSFLLRGELPACNGKAPPTRYYRRLEQLLRQRLSDLPGPGELLLRTELYAPDETLCSVRVEAQLRFRGRSYPFFMDGCVWDLRSGYPLGFRALTGRRFSVRKLWPQLAPRREPEWLLRSFPDWEANTRKLLSRCRFYLEPDALVFYLPPGTRDVLPDSTCRLPFSLK